jgi:hypothetical protein
MPAKLLIFRELFPAGTRASKHEEGRLIPDHIRRACQPSYSLWQTPFLNDPGKKLDRQDLVKYSGCGFSLS